VPPITTDLLQWLVNQGIGFVVSIAALYLLLVRMDRLDKSIEANTLATQNLVALVAAHMPPQRARRPPDE
jgi:hypothetical protein